MDDLPKSIFGIPVIGRVEDVIASGAPYMAVPLKFAIQPFDSFYVQGTKSGYECAVCKTDCILAPVGQAIVAHGKNPVVCMECAARILTEQQE